MVHAYMRQEALKQKTCTDRERRTFTITPITSEKLHQLLDNIAARSISVTNKEAGSALVRTQIKIRKSFKAIVIYESNPFCAKS